MTTAGHNSKVKAGPVNADRLKSFIERIEKLEEERKAIGGDVKDVYSEAKGVGYDVATMRKIVALRSKDAADRAEADTLLDVYKHALGMESTGRSVEVIQPTEEELEDRAGRIVAEVDRCMTLVTGERLPRIEDIQSLIGCSGGKAFKLRKFVAERLSRETAKVRENEKAAAPSSPQTSAGEEHGKDDPVANSNDGENGEASQGASPATSDRAIGAATPPLPNPEREARSGAISEEGGAPNPVRDGEASADERDASASSSPPIEELGVPIGSRTEANSSSEATAAREQGDDRPGNDGRVDGADAGGTRRDAAEHGTDRGDSEAPARLGGEAGPEMSQGPELQNLSAVTPETPQKVGAGDPRPEGTPTAAVIDDLAIPDFLRRSSLSSRGEG